MKSKKKLAIKVLLVLFIVLLYRCDFFMPFDLEFVELSTDTLNFGLFENEKQFIINYKDSSSVSWEIIQPSSWIEVTPMSGFVSISDPDTVTIKIDRKDQKKAGIYKEKIIIGFQDKTNSSYVNIEMEMKALLQISRDSLRINTGDTLTTFRISNDGNIPLKWNFISSNDWIKIQPAAGILNIDSSKFLSKVSSINNIKNKSDTTINVKIDRDKLISGNNNGIIISNSEAGLDSIKISTYKPIAALLKVSANKLDFGENLTAQKILIENLGEETLNWNVSTADSWVKISPSSGSFSPAKGIKNITVKGKNFSVNKAGSSEIEITVNREGLLPGQHNSSVEIKSNGGNATIDITAIVLENPILNISNDPLDFGKTEILKRVQISNSGTGKLIWTASSSQTWINVIPRKDSILTGSQDLNVSVLRIGLQEGDYSGSVDINSNGGSASIPVKMSIGLLPQLSVSASSFSFTKENTEATFEISNTGEGLLTWSLTASQNWINLSETSGTTSTEIDEIKVTITTEGLVSGVHSGNIQVNSDFGNASIPVSLTIEESPVLAFSASSLNFGESDSSKVLEINNDGGGNLTWEATTDEKWIMVTPASGSAKAKSKNDVSVIIKRHGLTPGNYSGKINITSNGGDAAIDVSMSVKNNADLFVNPKKLSFTESDTSKTFEIRNNGDIPLEWNLSIDGSWITTEAAKGVVNTKEKKDINVKVNRTGLSSGDYEGKIFIESNGGDETIEISMTVDNEAELSIKPVKYNLGDRDTSQTFEIENKGNGILNWQLETESSWIFLPATTGSTKSKEKTEIEFFVNRTGLTEGDYNGVIKVTSNGGDETIEISIKVTSKPKIEVSENKLDFGADINSLSFRIANAGSGELNWSIKNLEPWISVTPDTGSIITGESIVIARVNRNGLEVGKHKTDIEIISNGGDKSIKVTLEIAETPELSVSPTDIDFGSSGTRASFTIQNAGNGSLSWNSEIMYITKLTEKNWLGMSSTSGNVSTSQTIELSVDKTGLPVGQHNADIQVYSDGGNATIHLYMSVIGPLIDVSTSLMDFGETETEQTFDIRNSGAGELIWEISSDAGWLSITPASGSTTTENDVINVVVNRELAAASSSKKLKKKNLNSYTGNITITSNDQTKNIEVKMLIPALPKLEVSTDLLEFSSFDDRKTFQISNVGGGGLSWSVETESFSSYIINTDPSSGTVTTDPATVTVTIDPGGLGTVRNNVNKTNNGIISFIGKILVYGSDDSVKQIDLQFVSAVE